MGGRSVVGGGPVGRWWWSDAVLARWLNGCFYLDLALGSGRLGTLICHRQTWLYKLRVTEFNSSSSSSSIRQDWMSSRCHGRSARCRRLQQAPNKLLSDRMFHTFRKFLSRPTDQPSSVRGCVITQRGRFLQRVPMLSLCRPSLDILHFRNARFAGLKYAKQSARQSNI